MTPSEPREVYFEFITIGATVKVVAIDADSGTEVSVIAPAGAAQGGLERLALAKLWAILGLEGKFQRFRHVRERDTLVGMLVVDGPPDAVFGVADLHVFQKNAGRDRMNRPMDVERLEVAND